LAIHKPILHQTWLAKFACIGVGPGKTPSKAAATNSTLNAALQTGITEGEKLINTKNSKHWNTSEWLAYTDRFRYYLLRAAVAKYGLGGNAAEEASYPVAMTDSNGKNLTGGVNYTIHFKPSQIPPVNKLGFWSITMYKSTQRLVPNPINRRQNRSIWFCVCIGLTNRRHLTEHGHHHQYSAPMQLDSQ
jgi:hypothetical protein